MNLWIRLISIGEKAVVKEKLKCSHEKEKQEKNLKAVKWLLAKDFRKG